MNRGIVDRLKTRIVNACVPQLEPDDEGNVACLMLVSFPPSVAPAAPQGTRCGSIPGYVDPDPSALAQFEATQAALGLDGGADAAVTGQSLAGDLTCELPPSPAKPGTSCEGAEPPGWCYVTGSAVPRGTGCTQAIVYTSTDVVPLGATISLQCIATAQRADGG